MLVTPDPTGVTAGQIAQQLEIPPSSLSFHLHHRVNAGLLKATRQRRNIYYAVDAGTFQQLLSFLAFDCCGRRPELCGQLARVESL